MEKGYKNKNHLDAADFVFKHLREGERKFYGDGSVPQYSGHDVRHVIQSYGWVFSDIKNALSDANKRIKELEEKVS